MVYSPCLHPVRVFNESLGTTLCVPCGHCDACLVNKGHGRAERVDDCFLRYPFRYLVTLTFSDENLPLAVKIVDDDGHVHLQSSVDVDYKQRPLDLDLSFFSEEDMEFVDTQVNKFGGVPVLSRSIVKLFKKRLRKFIFQEIQSYEEIYIYSVGEYGPETFRPHYHLLFGFKSARINSVFEKCVNKAWSPRSSVLHRNLEGKQERSYGHVDVRRVYDQGGASYCAQYLSCVTHLPLVYRRGVFKPFSSQSVQSAQYLVRHDIPSLRQLYDRVSVTLAVSTPRNTETQEVMLPAFIENRLYPRIPCYCRVPEHCLVGLYSLARRFQSCTAHGFAQLIIDGYLNGAYVDANIKFLYWLYDFRQLIRDGEYDRLVNRLKRFFYAVRRVYMNCTEWHILLSSYLKNMVLYYSRKALLRLKEFYEFQEDCLKDFYNPCQLSQLFMLYSSTDYDNILNLHYYQEQFNVTTPGSLSAPACQHSYSQLMRKILLDTTKTKKRNDHFNKVGKVRKPYVPHIPRGISKFMSIV